MGTAPRSWVIERLSLGENVENSPNLRNISVLLGDKKNIVSGRTAPLRIATIVYCLLRANHVSFSLR